MEERTASVFRVENRSHRVLRNIGGTYLPICGGPGSVVGIANSLGWTVRGSNPGGGEIFRTCPDRPWGPPSLLYNGYWVFAGVKSGWGMMLTPHPLLVPLVMKEWSYTSTPPMGRTACTELQCLYKGALYLLVLWS